MICVLEDMDVRVDALREALPEQTIHHARTVTEFLALPLREASLIILDHDLGSLGTRDFQVGPDGKSGRDAVRGMPAVRCPILIWSWNEPAAIGMHDVLVSRGMGRVFRMPFSPLAVTRACQLVRGL